MAEVQLKSVSKGYPGAASPVVNDVSFEVKDKEFMVLVGPSGCGKSTTLRIIAGLEEPSAGEVYIDGKNITKAAPKDRDIAMVFQNYSLYPHLNVYENLAFSLKMRKHHSTEIKDKVQKAAEILDIEHLLKRKPKELSGGQRQRVAVGRAIVREPKVFLFDEPLSNLDAKLRVQMRTEILKLHHQIEATIIYVTHDQMEAMTMGDRIVAMKDGIIQQIDEPLTIYNNPTNEFVAGFIGSPAMNFIDLIIEKSELRFDGIKIANDDFNLSKLNGVPKKLGIRPERLHINASDRFDVHFDVTIEVSEKMGHESLHYVKRNNLSLIVREMEIDTLTKPGVEVKIGFNLKDCHFFDESGALINISAN